MINMELILPSLFLWKFHFWNIRSSSLTKLFILVGIMLNGVWPKWDVTEISCSFESPVVSSVPKQQLKRTRMKLFQELFVL